MCGRFALATPPSALRGLIDFSGQPNLAARYNIAPQSEVAVLRAPMQKCEIALLRWGLLPAWADAARARPQINARAETILQKPSFKDAFAHRRCLMPADAFYEWHAKSRQPHAIRRRDGAPFMLAGIWEARPEQTTCAILTQAANARLAPIHHRMPVMLARADWEAYLHAPPKEAAALARLCAPEQLHDEFEAHPISERVNKIANNDRALWDVVPPQPPPMDDLFDAL